MTTRKQSEALGQYSDYIKSSKELEKEFSPEEREKIKASVGKLNEKFLEAELTVPDHIYVELPLIKDLHIGALFAMILHRPTANEDYKYIMDNLGDYQLRFYDDPLRYFPKLNISEEEYKTYRDNPRNHDEIFTLAPFTHFSYTIKHNLEQNAQHAQMKGKFTNIPIPDAKNGEYVKDYDDVTFYINTYPLQLHKHHQKNLQVLMSDNFGVNTLVFYADPKTIKPGILERMDEINTYMLRDLMANEAVKDAFSREEFVGKYLFAPLLTDPKEEENFKGDDDLRRDKSFVANTMQLFCFFRFLEAARYSISLDMYKDDSVSDEELLKKELPNIND